MIDKTLSRLAATHLRANGALLAAVLEKLPRERLADLEHMIAGGVRIGLESTINANGSSRILLVGIEQEGRRLVLAEVAAQDDDALRLH